MNGIAEVLVNLGYTVSGSDLRASDVTKRLEGLGAEVTYEHRAENVIGTDVVVVSTAIDETNQEVITARNNKIPIIKRAEMLAELMRLKLGIAVAGSHGKTTTTSMVASVLAGAGLDPTVINGGIINSMGTSARLGASEYLVAEADESDASFLHLFPNLVVVTNIDTEHLDFYGNLEGLKKSFVDFINKVPFYGSAILCLDDEHIQGIIPDIQKKIVTYGTETGADLVARRIELGKMRSSYDLYRAGELLTRIDIKCSGLHNVKNSLAALAVGLEMDLDVEKIKEGILNYSGVKRRLELYYDKNKVSVLDDYGHHPTEIKATLGTLKGWKPKRLIVVFQPHRYTRTETLFNDFSRSFYQADLLIVNEVYAAGQKPIPGISGASLADSIREYGHRNVRFIAEKEDIVKTLAAEVGEEDIVLTLGAGDIWRVAEELARNLKAKES